jgi:hypothetical protein
MWLSLGLLCFAIAALLTFWLRARLRQPPPPVAPQRYAFVPPSGIYTIRTRDPGEVSVPFLRGAPIVEAQHPHWREGMQAVGDAMRRGGVGRIVFVHGTFVGDDPLSLVAAMRVLLGKLNPALEHTVRALTKAKSDQLLGDFANYSPEYVSLFREALGGGIPCSSLVWPSANHHLARLRGAISLLRTLAEEPPEGAIGRGRTLILGHSHAGQVFALLTQLLYPSATGSELLAIAKEAGEDLSIFSPALKRLARARLDLVTFGMPPRYGFASSDRYRLLHIVNHRGQEPKAGSLFGVLQTIDGDYIQQWGIAGSDLPAGTALERRLNERIDRLLGHGMDVKQWLANIRHRTRVSEHGHTLLVDYGDQGSGFVPNCQSTVFGHGVYTAYEAMLFNSRLIVERFYSDGRKP